MSGLFAVMISGFSIGLIGSFHCVGMCGPLALSLPIHHLSRFYKSAAVLLYNVGRAFSYGAIGLLFGLLGQGFALFKLQQYLSIFAGLLILAILLNHQFGSLKINPLSKFTTAVKLKLSTYLKSEKSLSSYFSIGIINGFLPCGLVYVALATALASGSLLNSSLLMFFFGLGTLPMMALTMVLGKFISSGLRIRFNKMIPNITMVIAILLILRGLNLGIPYVSPAQHPQESNGINPPRITHCH